MEIKIHCSCGTKYKFEADPVESRLPAPVACPACGLDGTEAANEYIRQAVATVPKVRVKVAVPASAAVPAPPATPIPPAASENPLPEAGAVAAPRTGIPPMAPAAGQGKKRGYGEPNLALGTAGAVGAAILGMIVWYLIIVGTNTEFGILAWGVGAFIGFGCRVLGAGYSQKLGIIAGVCAFVAIVGGEYLATRTAYQQFLDQFMEGAYEARLEYAQRAVQLETEEQTRAFLAEGMSDEEETVAPADITPQQLAEFRQDELPKLKDFAEGRPTKAEFEREVRASLNSARMQAEVLKHSVSLWTVLWLFLGVGSAYRLGVGETQ